MRMKFRGLAALLSLGLLISCSSKKSTSPSTGTLYVTTQGDSLVSAFNIDLGTGKITANGSGVATGSVPSAMVLTSAGDAAFVANRGSDDISSYTVNADGTLAAVSGTQAAGTTPMGMAIDSAGHLFVANQGSDNISVFSVSGTTLAEVTGSPFATAPGPISVAVTPDAKFLYVANQFNNTVSAYSVDSSGALTQVIGSPYTAGTTPSSLTVSSDGKFLYVANFGSNNISVFTICAVISNTCVAADGSLIQITGSPFSAGIGPVSLAIDPTGTFFYVADEQSNQVSQYKINTSSGSLTADSPATISTGVNPVGLAIHPGGTYLYVTNSGGASISGYSIDATSGALNTVEAPVSTGAQPSAVVAK
jgi:6-phosphogluconolactonase